MIHLDLAAQIEIEARFLWCNDRVRIDGIEREGSAEWIWRWGDVVELHRAFGGGRIGVTIRNDNGQSERYVVDDSAPVIVSATDHDKRRESR